MNRKPKLQLKYPRYKSDNGAHKLITDFLCVIKRKKKWHFGNLIQLINIKHLCHLKTLWRNKSTNIVPRLTTILRWKSKQSQWRYQNLMQIINIKNLSHNIALQRFWSCSENKQHFFSLESSVSLILTTMIQDAYYQKPLSSKSLMQCCFSNSIIRKNAYQYGQNFTIKKWSN